MTHENEHRATHICEACALYGMASLAQSSITVAHELLGKVNEILADTEEAESVGSVLLILGGKIDDFEHDWAIYRQAMDFRLWNDMEKETTANIDTNVLQNADKLVGNFLLLLALSAVYQGQIVALGYPEGDFDDFKKTASQILIDRQADQKSELS